MKTALIQGAKVLGLQITDEQCYLFEQFTAMLLEWNEKINLTAITEPEQIAVKHYLDSLALLKYAELPNGAKIIDVGTGAGFPSIPLLIARSDLKITMLDGTEKRLKFIGEVLDNLGLQGTTLHMRAEEAGKNLKYREGFDFAVARAVARLNILSEYCLPFVKVGGFFIAMKSSIAEEAEEATPGIKLLGGAIEGIESFSLPDSSERNLVFVKKISQISSKYPRASAQISKKPLK